MVIREPRRFRYGNVWRRLVPLTAIAGITVAGIAYAPYGYAAVSRPICQGVTDEGCQLRWQEVPTDDGGQVTQCVQFCAQGGPRPRRVAAVAAPLPPQGACQLAVFAGPNFAGPTEQAEADFPELGEEWGQKIASVRVLRGSWDFFTDENYEGEGMRLTPGDYPDLGPDWTAKINSFMCSEPDGQ